MDNAYVFEICKPGKGAETCRYLMMGPRGWECGKLDPDAEAMFDRKVLTMTAKADNCEGKQ